MGIGEAAALGARAEVTADTRNVGSGQAQTDGVGSDRWSGPRPLHCLPPQLQRLSALRGYMY